MTQSKIYRFASYTFKPGAYSVETPEGRVIHLPSRVTGLLLTFCEHPGQVLTFDELIERVWKDEEIGNSTVARQICELRKLLNDDPKKPRIIKTVHGIGFSFIADVAEEEEMDSKRVAVINQDQASAHADKDKEIERIKESLRFLNAKIDHLASLLTRQPIGFYIMLTALSETERARVILDVTQRASQRLIGPEQKIWIGTLESIDDYLKDTLSYYNRNSSEKELELAVNLSHFWLIQGRWSEGCEKLESSLSRQCAETLSDSQALGLSWLSYLSCCRDDYDNAEQTALRGIKASKQIGNDEALALALHSLASTSNSKGKYSQARSRFIECLKIAEASNIDWLSSWTLRRLGYTARDQGDYKSAESWFLKSLSKMEELENGYGVTLTQLSLSMVTCAQENIDQSKIWLDKALENQGDDNKEIKAFVFFILGKIEEAARSNKAAIDSYRKSLDLYQKIGDKRAMARIIESIARTTEAMGHKKESANLFGSAQSIRKSISAPLTPAEQKSYGSMIIDAKKKYFREFEAGSQSSVPM